jgi:hypothetical protein
LDEWLERVCNSVPVPCAPDGLSVVGTIVVGATVGVDVVGANVGGGSAVGASVGVDMVGASVGVAAAHTIASSALHGPHCARQRANNKPKIGVSEV